MNRGYVKIYRKCLDTGILRNALAWQFLSWCLLKATHKPHKHLVGSGFVELQPGQFVFGRASAAKELGSTERKIRTCLELLKNIDFLTIHTTNKYSIITIVNWHTYQDERPADGQQVDQQATSKRPADDHKQTHNTETQEEDKKETKTRVRVREARQTYDSLVEEHTRDPELRRAFSDFIAMRAKAKAPFTNGALTRTFVELEKLAPGNDLLKAEILWQSVQRGWSGVFPLRAEFAESRASPGVRPLTAAEEKRRKMNQDAQDVLIARARRHAEPENDVNGAIRAVYALPSTAP